MFRALPPGRRRRATPRERSRSWTRQSEARHKGRTSNWRARPGFPGSRPASDNPLRPPEPGLRNEQKRLSTEVPNRRARMCLKDTAPELIRKSWPAGGCEGIGGVPPLFWPLRACLNPEKTWEGVPHTTASKAVCSKGSSGGAPPDLAEIRQGATTPPTDLSARPATISSCRSGSMPKRWASGVRVQSPPDSRLGEISPG